MRDPETTGTGARRFPASTPTVRTIGRMNDGRFDRRPQQSGRKLFVTARAAVRALPG